MKNTINRDEAIRELNRCFKESQTYNEAVSKFFQGYICEWMKINPAHLPTEPQVTMWKEEDGTDRVLPYGNLVSQAMLKYKK